MPPRDPWTPWKIWAVAAIVLILLPIACSSSHAQGRKTPAVLFDCQELAEAVASFADFRDTGADVERVIARLRKSASEAVPARQAVVERELRRLWAEGLPQAEAAVRLHRRCTEQLGDMGRAA